VVPRKKGAEDHSLVDDRGLGDALASGLSDVHAKNDRGFEGKRRCADHRSDCRKHPWGAYRGDGGVLRAMAKVDNTRDAD
jgi:hypothetical protein